MPEVIVTWNSMNDAHTCQKCKSLHGYTWTFTDEIPNVLTHPQYGVVWDILLDQTRAHGFQTWNCRCWLTINIDDSDLANELNEVITKKHDLEDKLMNLQNKLSAFKSLLGK